MAICQFYQRGHCRYGDNCWNQHVGRDKGSGQQMGGGGDRKIDMRNSFAQNQNPFQVLSAGGGSSQQQQQGLKPAGEPTMGEIFATISQEMDIWQHSHMWPFSCFTYAKDLKSFPGLEDHSPEEVRWKAYEAQATGQSAGYKKWVSELTSEYAAKRELLKRPNSHQKDLLIPMVEEIQKANKQGGAAFSGSSSKASGVFGSQPVGQPAAAIASPPGGFVAASVFGGGGGGGVVKSPGGLFGNQATATATTAATGSSLFGAANTTSVFGGQAQAGQPQTQQGSLFGGQTQAATSAFGGQTQAATSAFGGQTQGSTSVFGGQTQAGGSALGGNTSTQSQSVFGGSGLAGGGGSQQGFGTGAFGGAQGSGLFGAQPASSTAAPTFGTTAFGGSAQPAPGAGAGLFGKPSAAAPAAAAAPSAGLFGGQLQQQPGGSVFGGSAGTTGGAFGASAAAPPAAAPPASSNQKLYTPLDQLSAADRAAYEAAEFQLDKLPMCPPPRELCF